MMPEYFEKYVCRVNMQKIWLSMKFVFGGLKLLLVKYGVLTQKVINITTDIHKSNRLMKTSIFILFRLCWITENKRYFFVTLRPNSVPGSRPNHWRDF